MRLVDSHLVVERPHATLRVLVIHHAGGSAMSYLPLAQGLPGSCEPCLFELPGRGMRAAETPAPNYRAAVADLTPQVAAAIDRPVLVVGHSLGAILAHGVVSALPPARRDLVRAVVVSGFASPTDTARAARHPAAPFVVRSRNDLLAELRDRGGCPPDVFADPDLLELTVTVLGHDLHLADTYLPSPPADLDAAYHVWYGRDDRTLTEDELRRWAADTPHPPVLRAFRGGHFYLSQRPEPALALADLATELAAEPA